MDVGYLLNHIKHCVCVLSLKWVMIMNIISPATIGIRALFILVFDLCSKMKMVQTMFWIYHRIEEIKTSTLVKTT